MINVIIDAVSPFLHGTALWCLVIWCCWHVERTCAVAEKVGTPVAKSRGVKLNKNTKSSNAAPTVESFIGRLVGLPANALKLTPGLMEHIVGHAITDKRAPVNMLSLSDFVFATCCLVLDTLQLEEGASIPPHNKLCFMFSYHFSVVLFGIVRNGLFASFTFNAQNYRFSLYNVAAMSSCVAFIVASCLLALHDQNASAVLPFLQETHYALMMFCFASLCNPLWMLCYEFSGSYLFIMYTAWTSAQYLYIAPNIVMGLVDSSLNAAASLNGQSELPLTMLAHSRVLVYTAYVVPVLNVVMGGLFILQRFELAWLHTRRLLLAAKSDLRRYKSSHVASREKVE